MMRAWLSVVFCLAFVSAGFAKPFEQTVFLKSGAIETATNVAWRAKFRDPGTARILSNVDETESVRIVQWQSPADETHRERLTGAGGRVLGYVPEAAFLVRMSDAVAARVAEWEDVGWIGDYAPEQKIAPELQEVGGMQLMRVGAAEKRTVTVVFFENVAGVADVAQRLGVPESEVVQTGSVSVRVAVDVAKISEIAMWDDVLWIEPFAEYKLFNHVARTQPLMDVERVWQSQGLRGAGEVIAVSDTGLDSGDLVTLHADFQNKRIIPIARGRATWEDLNGHGTSVASCALGTGAARAGNAYAGIAPEADLVFQAVMDETNKLSGIGYIYDLFEEAYDHGARIMSASWGGEVNGQYTVESCYADRFVWDYPETVACFAAGNEGVDTNRNGVVDTGSLSTPATAKNVISVGASESSKPANKTINRSFGFNTNPIADDYVASPYDGENRGMAAFSSRGPCTDGRVKPDVIAPGTLSTCAMSVFTSSTGRDSYRSASGTSFSTPYTAGAAALVREWLRTQRDTPNPNGALVKAILLNGARRLAPGQYGEDAYMEIPWQYPNNVEGWGEVSLYNTLNVGAGATNYFYDAKAGLRTNQTHTYDIDGDEPNLVYHVMMAYSDYPANPVAAKALVNDLDMYVVSPGGRVYTSPLGGNPDGVNNVERISFEAREPGAYTVLVFAYNVVYGPQPYALAIRSERRNLATPTIETVAADAGYFTLSYNTQSNLTYEIFARDTLAPADDWTLKYIVHPVTRDMPGRTLYLPMDENKTQEFYRVRWGL